MVIVRFFLWVGLFAVIPVWVSADGPNRHNVDFSGSWELDYQLSDHPSEKIRYLYIQARAQAKRAAERAQNSGRYVDPRILNVQSVVGLGRLTEKIAQATVLTITQKDDHIVINRNDDFALVCDFGEMGWKENTIGIEGCIWDEDQLAFQVALPDGLSVYQQFSIAADRSRINVATTVNVSGVSYPFTLNRVYMPFQPGEGLYECTYTIANQTSCTLSGRNE
ncbi:MAG: hypothetical protein QMC00_07630 [Pseudomonadales bacterium]